MSRPPGRRSWDLRPLRRAMRRRWRNWASRAGPGRRKPPLPASAASSRRGGETMTIGLREALAELPLVAILRGLAPENAPAVGQVLVDAGFRIIEVPLNSPRPFESIGILAGAFGDRVLVGAGTVL